MAANVPISSSLIPNSTACRHLAMMSLLVRSNTNEESTNESPVPWLPVSWNRSSSDDEPADRKFHEALRLSFPLEYPSRICFPDRGRAHQSRTHLGHQGDISNRGRNGRDFPQEQCQSHPGSRNDRSLPDES